MLAVYQELESALSTHIPMLFLLYFTASQTEIREVKPVFKRTTGGVRNMAQKVSILV